MEMTDLLNKGVGPEMTDVVSTGKSSQAGLGTQKEG